MVNWRVMPSFIFVSLRLVEGRVSKSEGRYGKKSIFRMLAASSRFGKVLLALAIAGGILVPSMADVLRGTVLVRHRQQPCWQRAMDRGRR